MPYIPTLLVPQLLISTQLNPQVALRYPLFCKLLPHLLEGRLWLSLCSLHGDVETGISWVWGWWKKNLRKTKTKPEDLRPFLSRARSLLPVQRPEAVYLASDPGLALLSPARAGNVSCPSISWLWICSLPSEKKGHAFSQIQNLTCQCWAWHFLAFFSCVQPTVGLGDRGTPGPQKLLLYLHEFSLCTAGSRGQGLWMSHKQGNQVS